MDTLFINIYYAQGNETGKFIFLSAEMHHTVSWCEGQPPKPWSHSGDYLWKQQGQGVCTSGQMLSGTEGCWQLWERHKEIAFNFYWYCRANMVWWTECLRASAPLWPVETSGFWCLWGNPCLAYSVWAPGYWDCAYHNLLFFLTFPFPIVERWSPVLMVTN